MGEGSADAPGGDRDRGRHRSPNPPGSPALASPRSVAGGGTRQRRGGGEYGSGPSLTRRRRDEAACSPSAERPSPWPRRLRGPPQPLEGRREVSGSAGLAALPQAAADARAREAQAPGSLRGVAPGQSAASAALPAASQSPARGRHVAEAGP